MKVFGLLRGWLVPLCISLLLLPRMGIPAEPNENDMLRVIAEGYLDNRAACDPMTMRFRIVVGHSATVDDAMDGKFLSEICTASVRWHVDGKRICLERKIDEAVIDPMFAKASITTAAAGGNLPVILPIAPLALVSVDGRIAFRYSRLGNVVNLMDPTSGYSAPGVLQTPLDLGIMGEDETANPGALIINGLTDGPESTVSYRGADIVDGDKLERVDIVEGGGWHGAWYFSPVHGYSLRRIKKFGPGHTLERDVFIREFARVDANHWLPARCVVVFNPDPSKSKQYVHAYYVDEFKVGERPEDLCFALQVPPQTLVNVPGRPDSQIRLERGEMLTPDSALGLLQQLSLQSERLGNMRGIRGNRIMIALILNAVVLTILVGYRVIRRVHRVTVHAPRSKDG